MTPRIVTALLGIGLAGWVSFFGGSRVGYADGTPSLADREREYEQALQLAQRKSVRSSPQTSALHAQALMALLPGGSRVGRPTGQEAALFSQEVLIRLTGRAYQVGETWEVASSRISDSMDRMTSDPEKLNPVVGKPAIFRYTVLEASSGPQGKIRVKVEPVESAEFPSADAKLDHLELSLKANSEQTEKRYFLKGFRGAAAVSPEGLRSGISALEFYPLDLPEIRTAEPLPGREMPELPAGLAKALRERGSFASNPRGSIWFEQDDFFGRAVQVLWQKGEPWPTYMKTSYGISVLLRTGGAR